jgi:hypothetical protein
MPMERGPFTHALPMAASLAGALAGVLIGLTLAEAADPGYARLPAAYWIATLSGVALGLLAGLPFSAHLGWARLRPLGERLGFNALSVVATCAVVGVVVGVVAPLLCSATTAWTFYWPQYGVCVATAPLYGALAGVGVTLGAQAGG